MAAKAFAAGDKVRFKTITEMTAQYGSPEAVPEAFVGDMYSLAGTSSVIKTISGNRVTLANKESQRWVISKQMLTKAPLDPKYAAFRKRCKSVNKILADNSFGCQSGYVYLLCEILMETSHGR